MIGILTEKPSAARNFAKALGGMQGSINGEDYIIVAARGHLYEFADPSLQVPQHLLNQYKAWDIKHLPWDETQFAWKRVQKKDVKDTLKQIKSSLSKCDEVCIATDVDPSGEGELLAWEILDELKIKPKKWTRMYFMDEAVSSLHSAFKSRKVLQSMNTDMDYVKAQFRSQWDFLSMQWTRIASVQVQGRVLRQGRLKSAMVLLVGDQLDAISKYKKIPFYQNRFRDENGILYSSDEEPTYKDKNDVPLSYSDSAVVVDSKVMKSSAPPKLLDLAGLSAILSSKGIKAKEVLAVYQKMYEAQIVSYPRTDDKIITPEQFQELLPKVDAIATLVGVDLSLLTHRQPRTTHVKTGGAHGANRPGLNVPINLSSLDSYGSCAQEIYILLAKSYLAMLAEDYQYEQQKGHVEKYPQFVGEVNVPKVAGFKAITSSMDVDDDLDLSNQGLGVKASPFIHEGFPPKPVTPTMKWLMAQLGKYDVGTGATRTSTYADVTNDKSKYPLLKEAKGKLTMAECGEMSYRLLPNTHIGNLKMTEKVMNQMKQISLGQLKPEICLAEIQQLIREDIVTMTQNGQTMRKDMNMTENKTFEQKEKVTGIWSQTGAEVSFNASWSGHKFTQEEVSKLLAGETINIYGLVSKTGNTYGVSGKLSEQTYQGKKFVGFERLGFAPSLDIPDSWCKHQFTEDEKTLLLSGSVIELRNCVSKKGNTFNCKMRWGDKGDGTKGLIAEF